MANSKRAAQGAGNIRKHVVMRDGQSYTYWEARVTVGTDAVTGKPVRRSFSGKTQKEVREKMQAAAVAVNDGDYFEPSKMTLARWLDIWLSEYTGDKKFLTVKHYKAQAKTHIKPSLGTVKLSELKPPQIQAFYNELMRTGHKVPKYDEDGKIVKKDGKTVYEQIPMSAKSVRNIHGVLTKALSTAVKVGYLKSNPAALVTLPKVQKKEIHPLTDEQVKAFLKEAEQDEYGIALRVILFTGLRESEAIGLTWDCVDFDTGEIKVCKQLQKRPAADGGFVFAPLKNDKTRVIKPAPFVMELLKIRRAEQAQQCIAAGKLWTAWNSAAERKTACVFTSALGDHLHPQTLYNHYKKITARIGLTDSRVHDLRHTFAVLSLQNGDDIKTVQGNLGHATAAFTLDVYGHVSERMKDESAARMERYIKAL